MEILISDVSLKQNGKETGSISFKEKLDLAKNLVELGVNAIEVGPLFKDKADEVLVKTLCGITAKTVLAVTVENEKQIEKGYSLVSAAKNKRIVVSVPVSPVKMEYSYGKKPQAVLEQIKNLTVKAAALCDDVEVSLCDATRAERKFLFEAVGAAINSGAKIITLTDEAGFFYPQEYGAFLDDVYANVSELKNVKLCVSCSDAFLFGAANNLTAILKGATAIKISVLKKFDLPPVESFAASSEYILIKKGFTNSLNKTGMNRILRRVLSLSDNVAKETAAAVKEDNAQAAVDDIASVSALNKLLKKLGYDLTAEDSTAIFSEYKRLSANKKVGVKEIEAIVASTALQVPPTYVLDKFSVQSSNVLSATASVVLKKNGEEVKGLSFGNGAIDAAFFAIENIVGRRFELDDFQIAALTEGKEAVGETLVKLRFNGKIYSGRGLSTDIVGASIRAYLNAVNKIVYEEENK